MFEDEYTAEQAAIHANKTEMYGRAIVARGPEEQRSRGYSGEYDGKIRRVPTIDNDKRQLIDCKYYPTGSCTNGSSVSVIVTQGCSTTKIDIPLTSLTKTRNYARNVPIGYHS